MDDRTSILDLRTVDATQVCPPPKGDAFVYATLLRQPGAGRRAPGWGNGALDGLGEGIARDGTFIARGRELAHLDHLLWRARDGEAGAVALRGEPGAGKTALVEAAIAGATDFSVVQLHGADLRGAQGRPEGWPEPLHGLFTLEAHHELDRVTIDGLRALYERVAAPLLVTLDDCHLLPPWLPEAFGRSAMARPAAVPFVVVMTWRDIPHAPAVELGAVGCPEHRLEGLNPQQAGALLHRSHGDRLAESTVSTLAGATAGNPAALLDVSARLDADQLSGWHPLPEPLPLGKGLTEAFGEALGAFDEEVRQALAVAAVPRLPVRVLGAALSELGLCLDDLEPAARCGVVALRGDRVDFSHPLVRLAAFNRASASFQDRVHDVLAGAFSALGALERAAHHAAQRSGAGDGSATRLFRQCARGALDRGDPVAASRHEEMAAAVAPSEEVASYHLVRAASLWGKAGELSRAEVCLERVSAGASSRETAAEARYQRVRLRLAGGTSPDLSSELEACADACELDAPLRAAAMLSDAVACRALAGDVAGGVDLALRADRIAAGSSPYAAAALGLAEVFEGRVPPGRPHAELEDVISRFTGRTEGFSGSPQLAYLVGDVLLCRGRLDAVARWSGWLDVCARSTGDWALATVPALLRAGWSLQAGRGQEAVREAEDAVERARASEQGTLLGPALATLVEALAEVAPERCFPYAAQLLGIQTALSCGARPRILLALACVELQHDRPASALAWVRAAAEALVPAGWRASAPVGGDALRSRIAPVVAEVMLLAGQRELAAPLVGVVEGAQRAGAVHPAWPAWVRGICGDDDEVEEQHEAARDALGSLPLVAAHVELTWGVRLAQAASFEGARAHLLAARDAFAKLGARGWADRSLLEVDRLPPVHPGLSGAAGAAGEQSAGRWPAPGSGTAGERPAGEQAPWTVTLLGSFGVQRSGKTVRLPVSLATLALKVVALRKRILVDELVEMLWPEAPPGVGARRLRNVLWRLRAACGDLMLRQDCFISLAPGTVVDATEFRRLGDRALHPETAQADAARLARQALAIYRGELLPGDRYADWTEGFRESLSRLHLRLLALLVDGAVAADRPLEALSILERLVEGDPYEENHYLRMAELQAQLGNRRHALSTIQRAERALAELSFPPSEAMDRLRGQLLGR